MSARIIQVKILERGARTGKESVYQTSHISFYRDSGVRAKVNPTILDGMLPQDLFEVRLNVPSADGIVNCQRHSSRSIYHFDCQFWETDYRSAPKLSVG